MSRTPMHRPKVRCGFCSQLVVARADGKPIRHRRFAGVADLGERVVCLGGSLDADRLRGRVEPTTEADDAGDGRFAGVAR